MKEDPALQSMTIDRQQLHRAPLEGEVRIPSGCAIAGVFHKKGGLISGDTIIRAMEPMHDRSNGLGGGFAAISSATSMWPA